MKLYKRHFIVRFLLAGLLIGVISLCPFKYLWSQQGIHFQGKYKYLADQSSRDMPWQPTEFKPSYPLRYRWEDASRLDSLIWYDQPQGDENGRYLSRSVFSYNEQGWNTMSSHYRYFESQKMWEPEDRYEFKYDQDGLLVERVRGIWDAELLIFEEKFSYLYFYEDNRLVRMIARQMGPGQLYDIFLYDLSYNADGSLSEQTRFDYIPVYGFWLASQKWDYTYDNEGRQKNVVVSRIDYEELGWVNDIEQSYSYDSDGNVIEILEFQWSQTLNFWLESGRYLPEYDHGAFSADYLLPWGLLQSTHKLLRIEYQAFELETETFERDRLATYYYSDQLSVIPVISDTVPFLFPNPCHAWVKLDFSQAEAKLQIIALSGVTVWEGWVRDRDRLTLEGLSPGMYLCLLAWNTGSMQQKLYVQ